MDEWDFNKNQAQNLRELDEVLHNLELKFFISQSTANVENARFRNNLGMDESMKQDLIKRGAIFKDSPGDRSSVPVR